jgi:hypothetical protein
MSDPTDDPDDTPYVHQVLYTNDLIRIISTWLGALFTVADPERVRRALQHVLDSWPRQVEMFENMRRIAQQVEERNKRQSQKGGGN